MTALTKALAAVLMFVAVVVITNPHALGWYIFPVSLCGLVSIHQTLSNWNRAKSLNAGLLVDALLVHLTFTSPILHVYWDYYMAFVVPPDDWAIWFGYMAWVNLLGLVSLTAARTVARRVQSAEPKHRRLDTKRFRTVAMMGVLLGAVLQVYVYMQFGGISGYVSAFTDEPALFSGWGWIFAISEAVPIMLGLAFVVDWYARQKPVSELTFVLFMLSMTLLVAFFGGLKGSRNHYVWELSWLAGLFAVWIRPISKKLMLAGAVSLIVFMMGYSYYKEYGANIGDLIENPSIASDSWRYGGRVFEGVILGDFSRADVQAYELYKLTHGEGDFSLAWGRTYSASFAQIIPQFIIGERPRAKAYYGTWLLYGRDAADGGFQASNIYGLAGEALLNFGILGVPLLYAFLGMIVGRTERFFLKLQPHDARWIMYPFVVIGLGWALVSDFDNLLVFAAKYGVLPFALYLISSRRLSFATPAPLPNRFPT